MLTRGALAAHLAPSHLAWAAALLFAWAVAHLALPHGLPPGIVLLGVVLGLLNALGAIGLILVFRAGRYVNFAQGAFGAAGAVLTFRLTSNYGWNWFLAVAAGMFVATALAVGVELAFIQRLFKAPRLILTVATIAIAQFAAFFELIFSGLKGRNSNLLNKFDPPIGLGFTVDGVVFGGGPILVLVVAPLVIAGFVLFFRRSRYGAVVQAAAENADRARMLGISVRSISTSTWLIVGVLSGIVAILRVPIVGLTPGDSSGPSLLLRALAPAMLAGLDRIPLAVVAALALGVVEQAFAANLTRSGPIELVLFAIILAALFARKQVRGRLTEGEERSFATSTVTRAVPRQLRGEVVVRLARIAAAIVVVGVAVAVPAAVSNTERHLASVLVVCAIAALSITVLTGYAGQVSFGQWSLVGFGALLAGVAAGELQMPFLVGLVAVPAAGALIALAIGLPALRIKGIFLGVTTLAFAVASSGYLYSLPVFQQDAFLTRPTILGVSFTGELAYYYLCLAVLLTVMVAVRNLRSSGIGRTIVAVRDNDRAAASYGIGSVPARLVAFAVSGGLAALAGYLYAYADGKLDGGTFPPLSSLLLFSAVVIGGIGSMTGALIGAFWFRGVAYFLPGSLQFLTTSLGLLLVLLFLPGGLGTLVFGLRDAVLRAYARRRGIVVPSLVADVRVDPAPGPGAGVGAAVPDEPGVLVGGGAGPA